MTHATDYSELEISRKKIRLRRFHIVKDTIRASLPNLYVSEDTLTDICNEALEKIYSAHNSDLFKDSIPKGVITYPPRMSDEDEIVYTAPPKKEPMEFTGEERVSVCECSLCSDRHGVVTDMPPAEAKALWDKFDKSTSKSGSSIVPPAERNDP